MINADYSSITSLVRTIKGKVELLNSGSIPASISGETIQIDNAYNKQHDLTVNLTSSTVTDFSGVEVIRTGKNLLNGSPENTLLGNSAYRNCTVADNNIEFTGDTLVGIKMKVKQGQTYTVSFIGYREKTAAFHFRLRQYTEEPTALNGTLYAKDVVNMNCVEIQDDNSRRCYYTFTPATDTTWITVGFYNANQVAYARELQVELGDKYTGYEPYKAQTATANAVGQVTGLTSLSPNMVLTSFTSGITINTTYQVQAEGESGEYTYKDALRSLKIDRTGEDGKFFGFGVFQKATVKLRDNDREINPSASCFINPYLATEESEYINPFTSFYITDINRDENTNELTITAFDALNKASSHSIKEVDYTSTSSLAELAEQCATLLGLTFRYENVTLAEIDLQFPDGFNLEGTETIKDVLDDIAEISQTIYYLSGNNLVFKRLGGGSAYPITKADYTTLSSNDNRTLSTISYTTELGDSVSANVSAVGVTQYVRDNAFWSLREDIDTLLENAIAAMGGFTMAQFSCSWRGNFYTEIGDKLELTTKDDSKIIGYILNDSIEYNGGLTQKTSWAYAENSAETPTNPTTIGEALKETYARVDKANKKIELVVSETAANSEAIANLIINTDNITASVRAVEESTEEVKGSMELLSSQVEAKMTAEDVTIAIQQELSNGVDKVTTEKGFIFNNDGMTIEERDADGNRISETSTQITENGMTVYDNADEAVLEANKDGVKAVDLHATTYLIIGNNSRFEDYEKNGEQRTGCFWIGG